MKEKEAFDYFYDKDAVYPRLHLQTTLQAELTIKLLDKALITAIMEGEDSAGRAKVKVMPVADTVARICDLAESLIREWEVRGWVRPAPPKKDH